MKTMTKIITKWAVIQIGYTIYGIGETRNEALEDAVEWLENANDVNDVEKMLAHSYTHTSGLFDGDLVCTNDEDLIKEYEKNM